MFEHTSLQEAYTGSLIAGKGKLLNNIKVIMERIRFKHEDWARVRFGAGTPWRRCWCVISPPDEKEVQKQQKSLKKKSAYDRSVPILKGDVKFYDTKKTKKAQPIATINDAYSAYAIYPQSKPLIDQSTLVKVEGIITIHSKPETTTEGFVFVMPEVHPAVTGFEMMLRWLFPLYDVYGLYGRPNRLIADTLDVRSLMFALPQTKRYGYLEILDVAQLIHEKGSQSWSEKEWRSRLKELTSSRMTILQSNGGRPRSRASSYRGHRNSLPSRSGTLRYEDGASIKSANSLRGEAPPMPPPHRSGTAPVGEGPFMPPRQNGHQRSVSEATAMGMSPRKQRSQRNAQDHQSFSPSRLSYEQTRPSNQEIQQISTPSRVSLEQTRANGYGEEQPPLPPTHGVPAAAQVRHPQMQKYAHELEGMQERSSSESERRSKPGSDISTHNIEQDIRPSSPPAPAPVAPPTFHHNPGAKPQKRPGLTPELRQASRMSITTLAQLEQVSSAGSIAAAGAAAAWKSNARTSSEDQRAVIFNANANLTNADGTDVKGMVDSRRPSDPSISGSPSPSHRGLMLPPTSSSRSVSPLSQSSTNPSTPQNSSAKPPPESMKRMDTSRSITRKPLPPKSAAPVPKSAAPAIAAAELPSPASKSSLESLRQRVVDEDALAQIIARQDQRSNTMESHQTSIDGSVYDDESTTSPSYASTRPSIETRASMERPRAGKLKIVGTLEPVQTEVVLGDAVYQQPASSRPELQPAIPSVDFGPTIVHDPTKPQVSRTPERLTPSPQPSSGEVSPAGPNNSNVPNSKFRSSPQGRNLHTPEGHHRTPSGGSEADASRSIPWQPAGASPSSRQSISAEEFVKQRASRATPVYAHGRPNAGSPSPSGSRHPSGEPPIQHQGKQSPLAKQLPPRPSSRMMSNPSGDYSAHLSAREQEYVAKATNSPLINMAGAPNRHGQGPPGGGLVGAIEAREQEKRGAKDGLSTMVQQAITQRQQQTQNFQQQREYYSPNPSPQMQIPGAFPPTPQIQTPQQQYGWGVQEAYHGQPQPQYQDQPQYQSHPQYQPRQQQWVSDAQRVYWGAPGSVANAHPYQQQQQQGNYQTSQRQQQQQQQQYYGQYSGPGR